MVSCSEPWLEVSPEIGNSEGFRRASVKDPHDSEKNHSKSKSNRGEKNNERTSSWANIASIQTWNNEVSLVPVISTRTCSSVHCISVDSKLDNLGIVSRCNPFKIPCTNRVSFSGMCEAPVHFMTEGCVNCCNHATRRKNSETAGMAVPRICSLGAATVVKFHHIILNGDGEGICFTGIERIW